MVIKRGANVKRHYILTVCNMTCLNLLAVSFTPETPSFGTFGGVAHPPPTENFFFFLILFFNCVYAHIWNLNCKNILILKKKEYRAFQGAEPS